MMAVVQRVSSASVAVGGEPVASIGQGLLVLLGAANGDLQADADWMAAKIASLRIFEDDGGKLNRDVVQVQGSVLMVSNFTVCGDAQKGRRPSFDRAAPFEDGRRLFDSCVDRLRLSGLTIATGSYGADMAVSLVNDGPVTLILESRRMD
ncbi:MAG: D-tyrosyl-tRNA(Tyr) deacylase [Armatimonadetes bacterium]|nr:D-tyrosyl-tRNA(Tyr) deacylase [Armatimonadota bacterium]